MSEKKEENNNEILKNLEAKLESLEKFLNEPQRKAGYEIVKEEKTDESLEKKHELACDLYHKHLTGKLTKEEYGREIETKALSSVVIENGGALIPQRLYDKIVQKRDRLNKIESRIEKLTGNGPLDILDFDFTPSWATHDNGDTITETVISDVFGKSTLDPQDYASLVTIPKRLQRRAMEPVETLLSNKFALAYRTLKDNKIMQGSGNKEPIGIITMLDAISSTANTISVTAVADISYGKLIDMIYLLDEEYRENATIIAHPDAIAVIRKISDTAGFPIFQPVPVSGDRPATLLGFPLIESKAMQTGDAGETLIVIGDLKTYILLEEKDFSIEVSEHSNFNQNKSALRMVVSFDGMPTDSNAFVRLTTDLS